MDYNNCYTQVFNSLIFDESLSVNARFVYILFASKKNMQWVWYKSNIMKLTGFGRDKVTFAINELQMAGWIKSVFDRKNGRFNGLKITVNDKPATEKPLTVDMVHINKDNKNNSSLKYSIFFSLGIIITYTIIGVISVLVGNIFLKLGNVWYIILSIILIFTSLYFFGVIKPKNENACKVPKFKKNALMAFFIGILGRIFPTP